MSNQKIDPALEKVASLLYAGDIAEAEEVCRAYLKKYPADVSAIRMLADIGLQVGAYDDAENLLLRCLELAPDFDLARLNYASLLTKRHRYEQSLTQIDQLLVKDPSKAAYLVQKASTLVGVGDFEQAIVLYRGLTQKFPDQAKLFMSLGHTLKTVGQQEEAIKAYREAINNEPQLGEAYWSLANLKTFEFLDVDIDAMLEELGKEQPKAQDFFHLCFALGYALEKRGLYDEAFEAYRKGNMVKRKLVRYDARENFRNTQRLKAFFTPEFFTSIAGVGDPSPDPIFIVGLPRAGSTLVEQILSSHSQVEGTMELPDIISMARRLSGKKNLDEKGKFPDVLSELTSSYLRDLGTEYLERTRIHRTSKPYFIDKMPNNFAHIGFIKTILPNAKIIDARRHPLAGCFSCFKQLFAKGQNFTYGLDDIGNYYRDYIDLMNHFDAVLPGVVHHIQYEDVLDNFEVEVRCLLDFCGLDFEENCLKFYETDRAVRTASSEQVRQPIYQSSKEQWRHFEPHLDVLKKVLGPVLAPYSI